MKKRVLSLLLCIMLIVGMVPTTAFAAASTWEVNLNVSESGEYKYNGQNTLALGFGVQSDDLKLKAAQSIVLAIDLNVLDFLQMPDSDVEVYNTSDTKLVENENVLATTAQNWNVNVYCCKSSDGKTGYMQILASTTKNQSVTTLTNIATVYLGFKSGKSISDLTSTSIRFITAAECATLEQSSAIEITNGAGTMQQAIKKDGSPDTLTGGFQVKWDDITPAKPAYPGTIDAPTVKTNAGGKVELNAVTPSAGGTVKYGYSTSASTAPTTWQDGTTFSGLHVGDTLYFYAKVVETPSYAEKVSDASAAVTVLDKELTNLEITAQPSTNTYTHGDPFRTDGMKVKATYSDGSSDDNFTGYTVAYETSGKGYLCKDNTKVTLKAGDKSVEVTGLTVNAKPLTVTGLTAVDREYKAGDTLVNLNGCTLNGAVDGEDVSLLSTPTTGRIDNAGVGDNKDVSIDPLSLTGFDAGNYTLTQPTGIKVNITRKNISGATITLGTQATYNGFEHSVAISKVTVDGTDLIGADYTVKSGDKATNVGDNILVIEGRGNYTGEASATWSLVAKNIGDTSVSITLSPASYDYTGSAITPDPEVKDGTTTLAKGTDYTVSYTNNEYAGTNAKVTITGQGNYTGTADKNFTITAVNQTPTITATAPLAKGGNTLDLLTLVSNAKGTVSFTIVSGDAAILSGTTLTSEIDKTGDVVLTVNITAKDVNTDGKNEYNAFNKDNAITVNVVDKIKEDLAGGVTQDGCTYGESLAAPSYTAPAGTTATTRTYTGTTRGGTAYSSATAPTEAGSYQVTVKCETATHIYEATSSTFTIAPKPITGAVVTLGTPLTYDTNAQTQTVSKVELDGTDITTSCDVTGNVQTNAGTYTLKVEAKTTGNYTGEVSKAFTIAKKSITPTITVTGTYEYNDGNEITPSFTVKDGTTVLASTDYTAALADNTNVGTGKITVKETDHGNYTFSDTPANFTINKKTHADVTAAGSAKYGANGTVNLSSVIVTGGTAAYSSMSDTDSVLDGIPTVSESILNFKFKGDAVNATKTATVSVTVTSTNYTDYKIVVTLTVNDKTAPIVTPPTAKTLTYNGSDQVLINPGSTTGGTLQYSLTSGSGYKTGVPTGKDATTYTVYYKVVGDADFADVAENSVSVVIKQKDVTVAPKNISITKGAAIPAFELTYKGLVSGDNLTVAPAPVFTCFEADGTTPVSTSTAAGTYTITWTNASGTTLTGTGSGNYQVTTTPTGTLTINNPSSSGGGSYVPTVQKPEITIIGSGKADLSADGKTATITAAAGYELASVVLNGKEMGKVEKLTGLKTGDKVTITFRAKAGETDGKEETDKMIAREVSKLRMTARSARTAKKNVKLVVKADLKAITDAGYTVKYKFYRSTKKSAGYKAMKTGKSGIYINTYGKKGTMYYYKARVMIYDKDGNFVAQTALKQCKYANRLWTK